MGMDGIFSGSEGICPVTGGMELEVCLSVVRRKIVIAVDLRGVGLRLMGKVGGKMYGVENAHDCGIEHPMIRT